MMSATAGCWSHLLTSSYYPRHVAAPSFVEARSAHCSKGGIFEFSCVGSVLNENFTHKNSFFCRKKILRLCQKNCRFLPQKKFFFVAKKISFCGKKKTFFCLKSDFFSTQREFSMSVLVYIFDQKLRYFD